MKKKVLIAMSGGVDSSVAVYLLKQQGFDCIGVTMKLFDSGEQGDGKTCCSSDDIGDARVVADRMGIPHYVFNFKQDFRNQVIDRFVEAYQEGSTPNPCIDCNRYLKFGELYRRARQFGMDYIATGHYARIEYDGVTGHYLLKKAADASKDQSYVLYSLTQEQLKNTLFPLGGLTKAEVRAIAEKEGFINANKRDSQDICFVPNGDYAGFIKQYTQKEYDGGNFVDRCGNILGRHKGLIHYTVGQRKGLGLALGRPMYVCEKNAENNTVVLCEDRELYTQSLEAVDFNWLSGEPKEDFPIRVKAKVRYSQSEHYATATLRKRLGVIFVEFDEPQRAVTKGQSVVLYDGESVVGGGRIN